jgi:hypothetical protein
MVAVKRCSMKRKSTISGIQSLSDCVRTKTLVTWSRNIHAKGEQAKTTAPLPSDDIIESLNSPNYIEIIAYHEAGLMTAAGYDR